MKKVLQGLLVICLALVPLENSVGLVIYDEAIDGNLSPGQPTFNNPRFTDLPEFVLGVNVVKGTTSVSDLSMWDFDYFSVTVPDGAVLSNWLASVSNVVVEEPGRFFSGWGLYAPPGYADWIRIVVNPLNGTTIHHHHSIPVDPLLPGTYPFANSLGREFGLGWFDYQFEFIVTSTVVPIPASLPMLSSSLAVIAFIGWRNRKTGPQQD